MKKLTEDQVLAIKAEIRELAQQHRKVNNERRNCYKRKYARRDKMTDYMRNLKKLSLTAGVFYCGDFTKEERAILDKFRTQRTVLTKKISKLAKKIGFKLSWGGSGNIQGFKSIEDEKIYWSREWKNKTYWMSIEHEVF